MGLGIASADGVSFGMPKAGKSTHVRTNIVSTAETVRPKCILKSCTYARNQDQSEVPCQCEQHFPSSHVVIMKPEL